MAKVAQDVVGPVHGGTCTKSFERDLVTAAGEVTRADGCHRKEGRSRETVLRFSRCPRQPTHTHSCGRQSHEFIGSLLPERLLKHVQVSRARLTSYVVLREEIKTYCGCRGHAHARSTKGGYDPKDVGKQGKGTTRTRTGQERILN